MVKASALTQEGIMTAIQTGSFYASNGPLIHDFYIEDGKAYLHTSPCLSLGIRADNTVGYGFSRDGKEYTSLVAPLNGQEKYIRAVCEDAHGRRAWSQPIWLPKNEF